MNRTLKIATLGFLFMSFIPASSVAHANGSPSMDWTFTNDGYGSPCATLTSPP